MNSASKKKSIQKHSGTKQGSKINPTGPLDKYLYKKSELRLELAQILAEEQFNGRPAALENGFVDTAKDKKVVEEAKEAKTTQYCTPIEKRMSLIDYIIENEERLPVMQSREPSLTRMQACQLSIVKNAGISETPSLMQVSTSALSSEFQQGMLSDTVAEKNYNQSNNTTSNPERSEKLSLTRSPRIIIAPATNNTRIVILNDVDAHDAVVAGAESQFHINNHPPIRKLKQEGRNEIAESERFLPFLLISRASLEHMEFNTYIDHLSKFVEENKVHFTNDADAEEYFKKCNRRRCWEFGTECNRILKVLRGSNAQKMIRDKEAALKDFLIYRENEAADGKILLDLSQAIDFRKFGDFLKERHPQDFECLRTFLMSNPLLTAYMRTIVSTPTGHFPYKGATQNLALWLHGETQSGKTTLAAVITNFLVVCKMQAANEKFMNSCGENKIPNKSFFFNIFQIEELKAKGGKGPEDLMDLLDSAVSLIKGSETSEWGSDNSRAAYHFPILITSNFRPCEFFSSRNPSDKLFYEAALRRIIGIEIHPGSLPDLSNTNRFGVSRVALAQFIWAFVYHSEIEVGFMGRSLQQPEGVTFYKERDFVQLALQELALPGGMKISLLDKKLTTMMAAPLLSTERSSRLAELIKHSSSELKTTTTPSTAHPKIILTSQTDESPKVSVRDAVQEKEIDFLSWSDNHQKKNQKIIEEKDVLAKVYSQSKTLLDLEFSSEYRLPTQRTPQNETNLLHSTPNTKKKLLFTKDIETLSVGSSFKSISSKSSFSRNKILLYLEDFLGDLAKRLLSQSQTPQLKAKNLLQKFTRWLEQYAYGQEPPSPHFFGKLIRLLRGVEILRHADGQLYKIDLVYWSKHSTICYQS